VKAGENTQKVKNTTQGTAGQAKKRPRSNLQSKNLYDKSPWKEVNEMRSGRGGKGEQEAKVSQNLRAPDRKDRGVPKESAMGNQDKKEKVTIVGKQGKTKSSSRRKQR